MKNQKGITLVALVITIIILIILAGVGIGSIAGTKGNIKTSRDAVIKSDLNKIEQAVLETYIKYKQNGTARVLKGTQISYADAKAIETTFKAIDNNISLKAIEYDLASADPGNTYYTLNKAGLAEMGITQTEDDVQYVVNYSTGEVFDNTNKKTSDGKALYLYGK